MGPDGSFVVVDNARVRAAKGTKDAATKPGRSREFPIDKETYDRIMALPRRSKYAFTTESGKPVDPNNFSREFRTFRQAIGMPELKLHQMRHTYISLMLRARVDLKTIQKNFGHSSPRMIMEVSGETFDESQREGVGRFRGVLDQAREQLKIVVA